MKKLRLVVVLTWSVVLLETCAPYQRKNDEAIQKYNTTGEAIAVDNLIQKYESEHSKFYNEKIGNGVYLEWPALKNKDLSEYCRKFLKCSIPGRKSDDAIGIKIRGLLQYEKENKSSNKIVLVHCKILRSRLKSFYITQAQEPNCVYSVRRIKRGSRNIFAIIHKYCDLEERSLKRKRGEYIVGKIHRQTGQPIAKDKYLLEYELEHQELLKGNTDNLIDWPNAMQQGNLDFYCLQYIRECAPGRSKGGIQAFQKIKKLQYQKLNISEEINVTIITCTPLHVNRRSYHMTKSPEANCVYALLYKGHNAHSPLFIIFKHCDFESSNDLPIIARNYNTVEKNVFTETEVNKKHLFHLEENVIPK